MPLEDAIRKLHKLGWLVAAHNDYHTVLGGNRVLCCFWLFTNAETGTFIKGEGESNHEVVSNIYNRAVASITTNA